MTASTTPADQELIHAGDHWLDEVTAPQQPLFNPAAYVAMSTFAGPARVLRRLLSFLATTPGKLFMVTVILTMAIAAAGMSMSNSSAARQQALDELLSTTEPMSTSAHNLYTSLSLADTIATTGFVQAGVESPENRNRYYAAIDAASLAATESVLGTTTEDQRIRTLVAVIQRELPVYTSMVETTRANHRNGNAVSAAYMSNASALMRDPILPAAAELLELTSTKVTDQQRQLTRPQWVPLSGLIAAVLFLILAQWWLWRLTHRRFNRGFLAATTLMVLAVLWVSASNYATWSAGSQRFEEASRPWNSLTASQIQAQQTRTQEMLSLVSRQSHDDLSSALYRTRSLVNTALADYQNSAAVHPAADPEAAVTVATARTALDDWATAHRNFVADLSSGRYQDAIRTATSTVPVAGQGSTSAAAFTTLDTSLGLLIADTREARRASIEEGLRATTLVSTIVFLLTIGAIISVWLGMRPRLQEYL